MGGSRLRAECIRKERDRIEGVEWILWREVFLFDSSKIKADCQQYYPPSTEKSGPSLFDLGYQFAFDPDNRLFMAINSFITFPDRVRNELDRHWTPDLDPDLDGDYTMLDCLFGNLLDQVCQYLVDVADQNSIDASVIARAGELTIGLIGKHSSRMKLWSEQINYWGDQFHPGEWPECLLKLDSITAADRETIRNGKAELRRLESLITRWRQSELQTNVTEAQTEQTSFSEGPLLESEALEVASRAELEQNEQLMRAVIENEKATAGDELSRKLITAESNSEVANEEDRDNERFRGVDEQIPPAASPRLIVRFLRLGSAGKRSFSEGEVFPIEKERALQLLLLRDPIVELATPEELKRDRNLIDAMETIRKEWDHGQVSPDGRIVLVRFVRTGMHPKLGHRCHPGEVWKVDADTAYEMARGKKPLCELQVETEKTESDAIGNGKGKLKKSSKTSKKPKYHAFVKALSTHHQYEEGSCLNFEPATFRRLAKMGGFAQSTAKQHIDKQFGGIRGYKRACAVKSDLIASLRLLNNDVTPRHLLQANQVDIRSRSMDVEE